MLPSSSSPSSPLARAPTRPTTVAFRPGSAAIFRVTSAAVSGSPITTTRSVAVRRTVKNRATARAATRVMISTAHRGSGWEAPL